MEVARLVEDTLLKRAGAYKALGGSNPSASVVSNPALSAINN